VNDDAQRFLVIHSRQIADSAQGSFVLIETAGRKLCPRWSEHVKTHDDNRRSRHCEALPNGPGSGPEFYHGAVEQILRGNEL
jgi:hypothetical protein